MARYMVDSIDCHQFVSPLPIPGAGVQPISLFAGYRGGSYEVSSHACGNTTVDIDVDGTHPAADVLDIETGDATPDSAPSWVQRHNAAPGVNYPGILYCNRSTITAVANALAAAGLQVVRDYRWWIAILDGRIDPNTGLPLDIPDMTGVTAVQAWGANFFPGHNVDVSIVYDDAWKGSPVTTPVTALAVAEAVWDTTISRSDGPTGKEFYQSPALQDLADCKTFLLNGTTPLGQTNGIVAAILDALPDLINKAVQEALANNAVKVNITVTGTPTTG